MVSTSVEMCRVSHEKQTMAGYTPENWHDWMEKHNSNFAIEQSSKPTGYSNCTKLVRKSSVECVIVALTV